MITFVLVDMIEVPKRKPCQPFLLCLVATPWKTFANLSSGFYPSMSTAFKRADPRAGLKLVSPTKRERYGTLPKEAYFHYSQMSVGFIESQKRE